MLKYKLLGAGSYNRTFFVYDNERIIGVFKEQLIKPTKTLNESSSAEEIALKESDDLDMSLDTVSRSVHIWNEINPTLPARPFVLLNAQGWLCPYVPGKQASDFEITKTLIDIYQRTGRIVVDAIGSKNVITQPNGVSVCIDVGLAVKLDNRYGPLPQINDTERHGDFKDFAGLSQWRTLQLNSFSKYFDHPNHTILTPLSVMVIKSLLFLSRHRPELRRVNFLSQNTIAWILSVAYDKELTQPEEAQFIIDYALEKIDNLPKDEYETPPKKEPIEVNVDSLKQTIQSYLEHLRWKLKSNQVDYFLDDPVDATDETSTIIKKLILRYNTILGLNKRIQDKEDLDDNDMIHGNLSVRLR